MPGAAGGALAQGLGDAGQFALPTVAGLPSLSPEEAQGSAPWPWEMAAARKPERPAGWVSPLDGPKGIAVVGGAIAALLAGLWLLGTVQRRQKRKT
ncbi:hypothetical protein GBF35_44605 [Nonomuraea phyllanthi]|uniref:hypothetical protein n=1 Tax=Nonomuraea phyllanthi TaxID=2219224 RepID=UPI001292F0A0|nr:hypothetical protein [Nonomuraea phyllanthi]QFY12716.1 hypothetical protein GBF35_44605 [Nonomuraea phyllanthi]